MKEAMEVIKVCTAFLFIFYLHEGLSGKLEQVVTMPPGKMSDEYRIYFCHKSKECIDEDEKVCGFDELKPFLAVFGDMCTLYRANCMGVGVFSKVPMIVCDTRLAYDKAHPNETFDFIHLRPTETYPPPTQPSTKKPTKKPGYILRIHRMKLVNRDQRI